MSNGIDLSAIIQAVADETTVDASAQVMIVQFAAKLRAVAQSGGNLATIQAQLGALANQLEGNKANLSAAVIANTDLVATTPAATAEATVGATTSA